MCDIHAARVPPAIFVAVIARPQVDTAFCASLLGLFVDDRTRSLIGGHLIYQSGPHLSVGRTSIARTFLESGLPWMLSLDSDMTFAPDDVLALLAASDEAERPVIGGLYGGFYPVAGASQVVAEAGQVVGGRPVYLDARTAHDLVDVDFVGAGFLMIARRVLLALEARQPGYALPWWEEVVTEAGEPLGEDYGLCLRLREAGIPMCVHAGVRPGHMRTLPLGLG